MRKNIINIIKKISIIMIISQIIFMPISNAYTLKDIFTNGDAFLELGEENGGKDVLDTGKLSEEVGSVYNIVFAIAIAISVVIAAILGIKFMLGSVEEQAKIKEMIVPYIIGCIIAFGAFGIWKITIDLGGSVFNSSSYTKTKDGKIMCDYCGDELINKEQRNGKCSQCGKTIKGL